MGAAPGGVTPVGAVPGQFGATSAAIAQLERELIQNRAKLDVETVQVIEQNLAVIDAAIAEVSRALADDPGNQYLNLHLADTMNRKLQLLQEVKSLASQTARATDYRNRETNIRNARERAERIKKLAGIRRFSVACWRSIHALRHRSTGRFWYATNKTVGCARW